jgi:hypothetical protein
VLANVWYRYLPHLIVDSYGNGCSIDRTGSVTCEAAQIVNQVNDERTVRPGSRLNLRWQVAERQLSRFGDNYGMMIARFNSRMLSGWHPDKSAGH